MARRRKVGPPPAKARQILREGVARGKKLTKKQRGFMGARAAGLPVRRKKRSTRKK